MIALPYIPIGLTLSRGPLLALELISPLLFVAVLWAATKYSHRFTIGSVVILTLIPIAGIRKHGLIHPGVIGLAAIALVTLFGLLPRRRLRITIVDVAALLVLAGCVLSVAYGHQTFTNLEVVFFLWFCPFFAARSITASGYRKTVLKAFAVAGVVAIPFGIIEITYGNLFLKAFPFGSEPEHGIGVPVRRLGIYRAEGALGQPIPYAMFLSIAAVAAVTLWMTRANRRDNRWLYAGLGIVAIQATTLTRTGWLMLAVVVGLVIVLNFKTIFSYKNRRLVVLAAVGLGVIFTVPTTNELILGSSGTESAKLEGSANYRSKLIEQALQPGYIDPYGTTERQIGPTGSKSIDDEYVHAAWTWGYLPLAGFALMFVAFLTGLWRGRRDTLTLTVYATCIATMVAIESVAFLTQQEVLIWLLWGCASGLTVKPLRGGPKSLTHVTRQRAQRAHLATAAEAQPRVLVS